MKVKPRATVSYVPADKTTENTAQFHHSQPIWTTRSFSFSPTLQIEWVTMKQGCFSTAGTLAESGTIIVGTVW